MVRSALMTAATPLRSLQRAGRHITARKHANYLLICAYTLCVALEAWTSNGINVVLVDIASGMGASADETSWIITVYSAGAALSILLSHAICRITGERLYILIASLLFGAASAGCGLSTTIASLLAFRILQGLAGGAFMSRTLVLLMTHFDSEERSRPLRYYLIILFVIGRFTAPLACGFLSDAFSWRSLFWINVAGSLMAAWVFCVAPTHEKLVPPPSRRKMHFDFAGAALLTIGVACIQVVLSRGEVDNWLGSQWIRTSLIVGMFAHAAFVMWQLAPSNHYPLVQLRHMFSRKLLSVVLLGVLLGTLFSAALYIFPFYLRLSEVHSAFQTGMLLSISGLPMVALALAAPRFVQMVTRIGGHAVLTVGLLLQILSAILIVPAFTSDTPDIYLVPSLLLTGTFIFFTAVGLAVAGFAAIPIRRISNARTLYFGARQLGNSLGISLGIVLLDRREALHSQRLLESWFLRNRTLAAGSLPGTAVGMRQFGSAVLHQATLLAYQDMFIAIIAVCVLTMACVWLLPMKVRAAASTREKYDPLHTSAEIPQEATL